MGRRRPDGAGRGQAAKGPAVQGEAKDLRDEETGGVWGMQLGDGQGRPGHLPQTAEVTCLKRGCERFSNAKKMSLPVRDGDWKPACGKGRVTSCGTKPE